MLHIDFYTFDIVLKILSILLVCLVGVNTLSKFGVVVIFKLNQDYIAKNICVNRFNPKSCCKGKCYLAKELKKHNQDHSPSKTNKSSCQIIDDYVHENLDFTFSSKLLFISLCWNSHYRQDSLSDYLNSIFHPPSFSIIS